MHHIQVVESYGYTFIKLFMNFKVIPQNQEIHYLVLL